MFGIGLPELILILAIGLIVLGPQKLPEVAKSLGKMLAEFKKAANSLKEEIDLGAQLKKVSDISKDEQPPLKTPAPAPPPETSEGTGPQASQARPAADSPRTAPKDHES